MAAVCASALFGMIHGTAPGNVAVTGTFTIPAMIRMGYQRHFAAAVEAAASTGGILLPPVMGSTAFIMAEFLRIPYGEIIVYAAIPAILYYVGVGASVYFTAVKEGLSPQAKEERAPIREATMGVVPLIFPLILLTWLLLIGRSPMMSGIVSIGVLLVTTALRRETRINWRSFIKALEYGGKGIINVSIACAAAGLIMAFLSLSGLDIELPTLVKYLANDQLIIGLILTMIIGIILGMGMPVMAVYVILATVTVPILTSLKAPLLASHMFIFYFATLSAITPPVALASFTAAPIAEANLWKTGIVGLKLALSGFLVPYMFIYNPALLLLGDISPLMLAFSSFTAIFGVVAFSAVVVGWLPYKCNYFYRAIIFLALLF